MLPLTALAKSNWLFGQLPVSRVKRMSFSSCSKERLETVKRLMLFPFELEIKPDLVPQEKQVGVEEMELLLYGVDV